jgi:hypothetical protein
MEQLKLKRIEQYQKMKTGEGSTHLFLQKILGVTSVSGTDFPNSLFPL